MVENTNNKPVKTYKAGLVSLSLWENETKEGKAKSFTFKRAYQNLDGSWADTSSLKMSDLPKLRALIDEAYKENIVNEI